MEEETLTRTLLLDTYGELLTEKQRRILDLRYDQDLSLGEIAELEGVSRQAVRDNILRGETQLLALEETLGAVRRQRQLEAASAALRDALAEARRLGPPGAALSERIETALACLEE